MTDPDLHGRLGVAVLVVFLVGCHAASLAVPSTWINRDGRFYTNMNATLVDDGTLEQSRFAASWYDGSLGWNRNLPASFSNVALGRNGEHWPMHPWLMPVLATPFYLALGLPGALLFNVLGFGVIAAGAFRLARREASSLGAAAGVVVFLLGTAILKYAYDYHVDVFLLACLATGLAAILDRQGVVAGLFIAATLALKPTTVLLVPYALVLLWRERDLVTLRRAVIGGAALLGVVGLANAFMFGAPWVFGYMRVLIVVDGQQTLESDVDAFGTPLAAGLVRLWRGTWGVRHEMTLLLLAVPGLVAYGLRRRWLVLAATVATVAASVLVFAKYHYEGHRFLWPALLLLAPALALSGDLLVALVRRVVTGRRALRAGGASFRTGAVVGTIAIAGLLAAAAFGPPPAARLARDPLSAGALALGRHGSTDPASLPQITSETALATERPLSTATRFGGILPRSPLPTLLPAVPFAAAFGLGGVLAFQVLCAVLAFIAAAAVAATWARPTLVVAAVGGMALLPAVRESALGGGAGFHLAAALLAVAIAWHRTRARHPRVVGPVMLAAVGAWSASAPALLAVPAAFAVLAWARGGGSRARGPLIALVGIAGGWAILHLALYGIPFASPDDYVRVDLGGPAPDVVALGRDFLGARLLVAAGAPGPGRLVGLVAGASLAAMAVLVGRRPSTALLLASLWAGTVLVPVAPDTPTRNLVILGLVGTGMALPLSVGAPARAAVRWLRAGAAHPRQRPAVIGGLALASLFLVGGVRAAIEASAPFSLTDRDAVRRANVHLGDVPCDFLAWEHYAWECSHFDRGAMNLTGLVTSVDKTVGGEAVGDALVLSSGLRGQTRRIAFPNVHAARDPLRVRWGVPDGHRGGGELRVRVDGDVVDRFLVPVDPPSGMRTRVVRLPSAGQDGPVELALEMTPGPAGPSTVVVDGGFGSDAPGG